MTKQEILGMLNLLKLVFVKFSHEQAVLKAMRSSYLGWQSSWVPIENCETEILVKKGSALPSIKYTHLPLAFVWVSVIQNSQVLNKFLMILICKSKNHLYQGKYMVHLVG